MTSLAVHCHADESVLVQGMPDFALHSAGSSVIGHSALVPGTLQGWQSLSYRLHGLFPGFSAPKHPDANKVIQQATENEQMLSLKMAALLYDACKLPWQESAIRLNETQGI